VRIALVALLILVMADVQGQSPSFEDFRQAFIAGDLQQVDALLKASGNRPPVDEGGVTVLHKSIHIYSSSRVAIVERLISARLDVNARAKDGRTPLHWAANFDCANCAALLLEAGAQVAARNEDGDTPLHGASRDVVPLLLKAGADPLAKNNEGNVPLHRNFNPELLSPGVNVRNAAGLTPLHYAALAGNERAIESLLSQGADPEAKTAAAYRYRASFVSKAFGPGDEVPVGSRPLDLAKMQHEHSRWSTQRHAKAVEVLEKVTKRKGWFSR
jgi:ankyrin repeat protein